MRTTVKQYPWLEDALMAFPGAQHDFKEEWQWDRFMVEGKLFAALLTLEGRPAISLKVDPMEAEFLREQHEEVIPGYYCNKVHWNTVYLDGTISDDLLREMIAKAYQLIFRKLPKKVQAKYQ